MAAVTDLEESMGAFTLVSYTAKPSTGRAKKKRKGKEQWVPPTLDDYIEREEQQLAEAGYIARCLVFIRDKSSELKLPPPEQIVCLGLGGPSYLPRSRPQFVVLREIAKELGLENECSFYDPAFRDEDIEFFQRRGFKAFREEHPLTAEKRTLYFMPHCPRSLFDLLLERNWSDERIRNVVLLGNNLGVYDDPAHPGSTEAKTPRISAAASQMSIHPLPEYETKPDIFNDLALQVYVRAAPLPAFDGGQATPSQPAAT